MKILTVVTIALAVDVVILMVYIFEAKPLHTYGVSEHGDGANSTTNAWTITDTDNSGIPFIPWKALPPTEQTLTRIAFGSCASQHMPQPYWDVLVSYQPDITLLMGDNVYGDCDEDTCAVLQQAYRDFATHPSVQGAARQLSVWATLDDHDYGANDANANNVHKDLARQLFADFFQYHDLPPDGVYQAKVWGLQDGRRLQLILLDTRYSRGLFEQSHEEMTPYRPSGANASEQVMLGARQWQWLEETLAQPADLRLLVSSIQVLNDGTGEEAWRQLPLERQRLYELLQNKSTVILSGDRHVGGFYETPLMYGDVLREVTASSWTHSVALAGDRNCVDTLTALECDESDPRRVGSFVRENNFGTIEIDWESRSFTVSLRRAESTNGIVYLDPTRHHNKTSDAGTILSSQVHSF
jgi:alkaline phosphatase D